MIFTIGEHRVKHGNIMEGIDDLMDGQMADIVSSDPPWGNGNLKFWLTLNKKQNPDQDTPGEINFDQFLKQVFSIAYKYAKGIVIIAYGIRWFDLVKWTGEEAGLNWCGFCEVFYQSGSKTLPHYLHFFHKTQKLPMDSAFLRSLDGKKGIDELRTTLKPFAVPGGVILDPCCGKGDCARVSREMGMRFYGNELSRSRLNHTIEVLNK